MKMVDTKLKEKQRKEEKVRKAPGKSMKQNLTK